MSVQKIQENLTLIDKNKSQFENFVKNINKRQNIRQISRSKHQQQIKQSQDEYQTSQKSKFYHHDQNPQEDIPQLQPNLQSQGSLHHKQSYKNQGEQPSFAIKKLNKINPNTNKFYQEDMIRKQNSSHVMQIKSANHLPSWLFQQIRKNNLNHLKNINVRQSPLGFQNNIMTTKGEKQIHSTNMRTHSGQRYFNSTHGINSNQGPTNVQSLKTPTLYFQQKRKIIPRQKDTLFIQNFSSSFDTRRKNPIEKIHIHSKNKERQSVNFSDYAYNYCPQNQSSDKFRKHYSKIKQHSYLEKAKPKIDQNRPFQQLMSRYVKDVKSIEETRALKSERKRQPTISQQKPLFGPRINNLF